MWFLVTDTSVREQGNLEHLLFILGYYIEYFSAFRETDSSSTLILSGYYLLILPVYKGHIQQIHRLLRNNRNMKYVLNHCWAEVLK